MYTKSVSLIKMFFKVFTKSVQKKRCYGKMHCNKRIVYFNQECTFISQKRPNTEKCCNKKRSG